MARNEFRTQRTAISEDSWQLSWKRTAFTVISVCAGVFVFRYWQITAPGKSSFISWLHLGMLGLMHLVLVISLERSLILVALLEGWRYRLAFMFSLGIGIVNWALCLITAHPIENSALMVMFIGAFVGGMVATGVQKGWWENNFPPSQKIKDKVLEYHQVLYPNFMPIPSSKRIFDLLVASAGLILSAPVWILVSFLIWFEDPGPILFVKNSVGRGGLNFHQFKFRTMVYEAEKTTGPVLAQEGDERVLRIGRFLRKTALDELPQLVNILIGQMSFVGPRPQRTVLVYGYLKDIPEYAARHRVLPGLAGLAQVAGDYYLTPRQKLRFDCLYIQNISLWFDLKILALAFLIAFWYRWQPAWKGRLPRALLHLGPPPNYFPHL